MTEEEYMAKQKLATERGWRAAEALLAAIDTDADETTLALAAAADLYARAVSLWTGEYPLPAALAAATAIAQEVEKTMMG